MLFCPFPKNLDGRLLDDYTLGLCNFPKSGRITEKIPKYRYYRYFFLYIDIGFFSIPQQPNNCVNYVYKIHNINTCIYKELQAEDFYVLTSARFVQQT